MHSTKSLTVDALQIQERDEFRAAGWLKVIAPAKINLFLAIGARRDDGYHEALNLMHALALHDTIYMRPAKEQDVITMTSNSGLEVPIICSQDNLAAKALRKLRELCGLSLAEGPLEVRIEKNIPAQAGLGGGSSDAASTLVGAAKLWGLPADSPAIEEAARTLGADVAFFLKGGCALYDGVGENFVRSLEPSKQAVILVKPEGGVDTALAYKTFDQEPTPIPPQTIPELDNAKRATEVPLFNNLAPAAERILPELAAVHSWLEAQPGVRGCQLTGSGAATFALCESFEGACKAVAAARAQGWWARATTLSALKAQ